MSLFGSTDVPTSSNADPVATANTMAAWVKEFDLDGVDVDYEVSVMTYDDDADHYHHNNSSLEYGEERN